MHDGKPTKDILMLKYLEALGKMADGKATKIFMPVETSGILGGAAAIGEMLRGGKETWELPAQTQQPTEPMEKANSKGKEEAKTLFHEITNRSTDPWKKTKDEKGGGD